jgi:hypothetical protein
VPSIDDKSLSIPAGWANGRDSLGTFQTFYVDHPAGRVKITLNSRLVAPKRLPKDLVLNLTAGETRYVQTDLDPGDRLNLVLMDPEQAIQDLRKCSYVTIPNNVVKP